MADKMKNISYGNLATFAAELKSRYAQKTDLPTKVSDLSNDSKFQTEEQVVASINAKLSSTYKAGGSVAFASLPELSEDNLGLVVNVTDKFTATADFVEGAGGKHPAGTNVAVVKSGEDYKYDVLAGFVDLSGYVTEDSLGTALGNVFEEVTEAEIRALFDGTDGE